MNPLQFVPFWSFYVRHPSPDILVVTSPPHIISFCVLMYLCYRLLWKNAGAGLADGTTTTGGLVFMSVITAVVFLIATPNASLTLDRATQTATIRRFVCGIPYFKRIPLSEVEKADVREAPFSNQFYLQTTHDEYHLASWDAMSGQAKGTNAINQFLEQTPGTALYRGTRE